MRKVMNFRPIIYCKSDVWIKLTHAKENKPAAHQLKIINSKKIFQNLDSHDNSKE